jgi:hypothetical protein
MSFFQKATVSSALMVAGVALMVAASGPASAAVSTNLTAGDTCTVTSGPNKGKTGTYGSDGWCEGDWGGTECGKTKCKIAANSAAIVNAGTTAPARGNGAAQFKLKRMSVFGAGAFSK